MKDNHPKKVKCPICGCAMRRSTIGISSVPDRSVSTPTETYEHECKNTVSHREFKKYRNNWYCTETYVQFIDPVGNYKVAYLNKKTVDILKVIDRAAANKLVDNARKVLAYLEHGAKLNYTYRGNSVRIRSFKISGDGKTINIDFG